MKLNLKKKCLNKHTLIILLVTLLLPLSFLTNIKLVYATSVGYGVADDYLLWGGNTWTNVIPQLNQYGFTTVRLAFSWSGVTHSAFDFDSMDVVISQLRGNGFNIVLDLHNYGDYQPIVGSEDHLAMWRTVATYYLGQNDIIFELYNEPWAYAEGITTLEQKFQIWSYIIDQIRAIDPSRTLVFPPLDGFMWNDYSLDETQALPNYIVAKGNLIQTFHWWYWPYEAADWDTGVAYANMKISHLEKFLSHIYGIPVWVGETGVEPLAEDAGIAFEVTVLSYCRDQGIPFSLWMYPTAPAEFDDALSRINWSAPPNYYPPQYGSHSASTNVAGQIATFLCAWTDDYSLSQGILCTNYTGTFHNRTAKALSGTNTIFSDVQILPNQAGKVLAYKFYAKDTSNLWNVTNPYYLTTVASSPPYTPPITSPPTSNPVTINTVLYVYPTWHFGFMTYDTYINFEAPLTLSTALRLEDYWYFNEYAFQTVNANMTITNFFTNNKLVYVVDVPSGIVVTNRIYLANKGMPTNVTGASSWSYDPASKIITLQETGLGVVTVTLTFGLGSGVSVGFALPFWVPFLLRAGAILIPFGIIAYYFGKIKNIKTGMLTVVVILICLSIFFVLWYLAMALETGG